MMNNRNKEQRGRLYRNCKLCVSVVISLLALTACGSTAEDVDTDNNGIISRNEAQTALAKLENAEFMPGLWRIQREDDRRGSEDIVACVTPEKLNNLVNDVLLFGRVALLHNTPNEGSEFETLSVSDEDFSIKINGVQGGMTGSATLQGSYHDTSISSEFIQARGPETRKRSVLAERLDFCDGSQPAKPRQYKAWQEEQDQISR